MTDGNEAEKIRIELTGVPDEAYMLKARFKEWDGKGVAFPEFDWSDPVGKEIW